MKPLLTKRKQAWADRRKPEYLRGEPLEHNIQLANRYYIKLQSLIKRMADEVEIEMRKFYYTPDAEEYFAADASISSQGRIITNRLKLKFDSIFNAAARPMAESFVRSADKSSSAALHSSLKKLSGGLSLKTTSVTGEIGDIVSATVTENVALIKTISEQYLSGVQQAVMRSITTGNGMADLVPFLKKHKEITERRARMIANDQANKAFNNINRARLTKFGLKKYEWLHSPGSKEPRQLHIGYDRKIFRFDDPPIIDEKTGERGIPGQAINCRCRIGVVLDFED